ncbi:MFS domain-containing protein [Mycena indigotica]|uniref:MFS domain-containing protein n=1 Tax=Mycena indigotica TaxID=2126181 RepID=A0A8H6S8I5_9AGAR|nr:MFS domain-containing protein [Mycena indigotica]KAF7294823.1 MFS domain-containing protein [Mycena indigotica]
MSTPIQQDTVTPTEAPAKEEKAKPGASWKAGETQTLPKNNLPIVFLALTLTTFLAAMDQTIVATALPTIVSQLGGGKEYAWVGSSYMLGSAALSPLYGKLSDIFGRKPLLYSCIVTFLIGSALCGAAQNMTWLVVVRVVQGMGGGGIIQLLSVNITIGDIVSLEDRGKFVGLLGESTYLREQFDLSYYTRCNVGYSIGSWAFDGRRKPLVSSPKPSQSSQALTEKVSWRWCFWINLPTGGLAGGLLFFFLNLNPRPLKSFSQHNAEFDYVGLVLVVVGVVCVLLGFNFSETSWTSPQTIALLVLGFVLLFVYAVYECYTTKSPIIPPRLFKASFLFTLSCRSLRAGQTRTTAIILTTTLLHALAFFSGAYYLPLYFQVLGASATGAGVRMLPFSLGGALVSALSGQVVSALKAYRPVLFFAWPVMTLGIFFVFLVIRLRAVTGYGLMTTFDEKSGAAKEAIFPLIAALGVGCLCKLLLWKTVGKTNASIVQAPLIGLQAAMPLKDMATSTASYTFIRTLGATIAIAMGQVIITSTLRNKIAHLPNMTQSIDTSAATLSQNVLKLKEIPEPLRTELIHAYARSISRVWLVIVPIVGAGTIMTFFIRRYTLARTVVRSGEQEKKATDVEKGEASAEETKDETGNEEERGSTEKGPGKSDSAV